MYGTDIMINGFHGSDGPVSSARERAIFFPPSNPDAAGENPFFSEIALDINAYLSTSASLPLKTLAIIKPGVSEKAVDEIISRIVSCGIVVYKRENGMISVEQARMLAEAVWDDDEAKCDAAVEYLTRYVVVFSGASFFIMLDCFTHTYSLCCLILLAVLS
jgi:nucleoside diphosphate kinase